ncbi:MAG: M28 family peptidase [Planctomycetales bacterium]|nr:M28 family peptidase [Planctomycetales bacterium]
MPTRRTHFPPFVFATIAAAAVLACIGLTQSDDPAVAEPPSAPPVASAPAPAQSRPAVDAPGDFDGKRAFGHLEALCNLGPRPSGSAGMREQQKLIIEHMQSLGLEVQRQTFQTARDRRTGRPLPMTNLIVELNPAATERILLCAHYDTRPFPDRDPNRRLRSRGKFLGANDGASGTAALMELAEHLRGVGGNRGVDLVFFDGEEYVFSEFGTYFLGSTHFANQYADHPPTHRYVAAVLLDMIADKSLTIKFDGFSNRWSDSRPIVNEIWQTARDLGVWEFMRSEWPTAVRDDHLALHERGGIPAVDIIDFAYPDPQNSYWHTTADAPENCSAESLGKVGRVVLAWVRGRLNAPAEATP